MADEEKKVKKKRYFLSTLVLFIIFNIILVSLILFLDISGFINISKIFPRESSVAKVPYIGKYINYSYEVHLSEEDKIRETANKYQEILENKRKELEIKEELLKKLVDDIALKNSEMEEKTKKLKKLEEELKLKGEQVEKLKKEYQGKNANIEKFAVVYSKMTPRAAAKLIGEIDSLIAAEILEKMEDKRIASILEVLADTHIEKGKEIVEIMTKKGEFGDGNS